MMLSLKWLQGVTSQSAYAGFLPSWARLGNVSVTESSLPVKLLHQCSDAFQSAAFPLHFKYIRMELLSAPLGIISSPDAPEDHEVLHDYLV